MTKKNITVVVFCLILLLQLPLLIKTLQRQQELRQEAKSTEEHANNAGGQSDQHANNNAEKSKEESKPADEPKANISKALEQGNGKKIGIVRRLPTVTAIPLVKQGTGRSSTITPTLALITSASKITPGLSHTFNKSSQTTSSSPAPIACTTRVRLSAVTVSCADCTK